MKDLIVEATAEAEKQELAGWFSLGFFLGFIGILIVYLRSPQTPAVLLSKYQGDERVIFDSAYVEKSKAQQIRSAWIGFGIGLGFAVFLFVALADTIL